MRRTGELGIASKQLGMRWLSAPFACLRRALLIAAVAYFGVTPARAAVLTVDGDVTDWGFSVADNNASTFNPASGLSNLGLWVEDQDDNAGLGGFVGPHYGGQAYDAEALASAQQGGSLFITIVSGQRPGNGFTEFEPGDIYIGTSGGSFGIEVGGGAGGGPGGAITAGAPGSTYALDGSGFTASLLPTDPAQTAGSVWFNPTWIYSPFVPQEPAQIGGGGTHVGDAAYVFTLDSSTNQHSIIELSVPLSVFGGQSIETIGWQPSCGNDQAAISFTPVPEPSTVALVLLGLGALLPLRRRLIGGRSL